LKVQLQDWKKTETGLDLNQSRPEIIKTNQDRNRGPVLGPSRFWKIKDRVKDRSYQSQLVFSPLLEYLYFDWNKLNIFEIDESQQQIRGKMLSVRSTTSNIVDCYRPPSSPIVFIASHGL